MDANITINILITIKNKISMNIFKKIKLINTAKTATNLIKYTAIHAVKLHIVKLKLKIGAITLQAGTLPYLRLYNVGSS